jgi:hypothetical protein
MLQGRVKNGFFIEAGAWDFEEFSNTLYFEVKTTKGNVVFAKKK